jgi:hypothetical protein
MKINQVITEKSVSKQQQKFMGMVYAAKKGEKPASPVVAKTAAGMSKSDAKDFAKTKHKGLPNKVEEATGDPVGTVSTTPDASGKIKIKTPTGTEIETTKDALLPGAKPGTVQMKPDAAGDALKPGTQVVSAEAMGDMSTMPTTEFVKGIYAAAAENGMDAPDVEAVKKQMVLAPNGEVDIIATMQKAVQVFQSPEWKQMLADLDALVKRAEAQPNAELSRIQELAGMKENTASQSPVKVPPVPKLPAQDGEQSDGSKLTTNPDGTKTYAGAFGRFTFDKSGKAIKYAAPQFTGVGREVDLTSGNQTTNYSTGPMSSTQTTDAKGNVVSSNTEYELGLGKLAMGQDAKGIKSKSWTAASSEEDPITNKDMYALGNKDKEATYNRAMAQVSGAPVKESPELTAMLSIAGLR